MLRICASFFLITGLCLIRNVVVGQPTIRGTVRDQSSKPIPFCNVFLERNTVVQMVTATREDGQFVLEPGDTGRYQLVATSIGYKKYREALWLGPSSVEVDVTLFPDTVLLDQVVVQGDSPIKIKGDTVVYDATYFAKDNDVVLADLLGKLPGITVDEKGKVKFQGKEVSKIKIEDDDLFDKNYSILTKNLSADLIEQVEVLQNYSDNRLLKNIEDSEEVAINLKLKSDRKGQLFGDVRGETNLQSRYDANVNLVSFTDKWKAYALSSANTIGTDPTGDAEALLTGSTARIPGGEVSSDYLVPVAKPYIAEFKRDRYFFNQALLTSLHGIYRPSKKLKLTLQGYGYRDENKFYVANRLDYFTPTDTVRFDEFANSDNEERIGSVTAAVDFDDAKDLTVRYKFRMDLGDGLLQQQGNLNQQDVVEELSSDVTRQDHLLTITKRASPRAALSVDLRYMTDKRPQRYTVDGNLVNDYFAAPPSDTLFQTNEMRTRFWGGELNYYQLVKHGKVSFRAGFDWMQQNVESALSLPSSFLAGNDLTLTQRKSYAEGYYAWKGGPVVLTPGAAVQVVDVAVSDRSTSPFVFFNPRLGLRWKLSERSKFAALYAINQPTSTVPQLTPNAILEDYNVIAVHDDGFRTFPTRTLLLSYDLGNWTSGFALATTVYHKEVDGDYLVNADIEPNYVATIMNSIAGRKLSSVSVQIDKFFRSIKTNLKVDWNYSRSDFVTSVDDVTAPTLSSNHKLDISLRTAFPGMFNVHGGHVLNAAKTNSGLIAASNFSSLIYLDGYITGFSSRLNLVLHVERYALLSVESTPVFYFLDFTTRFKLKGNSDITLLLKGRNLLDEQTFGQRFVSYQSISLTVNKLIPRFVMAGVEFRF